MFSIFLFFSFFLLPNSILSKQLDFVCSQCGNNFDSYPKFKHHFLEAWGFEDHHPDDKMSYFRRDPMKDLRDCDEALAAEPENKDRGKEKGRFRWFSRFRGKDSAAEGSSSRGKHSAHHQPLPPPPHANANHCGHHHLPQETYPPNQILYFNTPTPYQQATFFNQYCALRTVNVNNRWWGFDFHHWGEQFWANGEIYKPTSFEKIIGNGNCLFSAIALALMGHVECSFVFREYVNHPDDVSEKMHGKDEHPIRHGEIEDIIALVKFYKMNIVIYYKNTKDDSKSEWLFYSPKSETQEQMRYDPEYPTIPLILSSNDHYDLITNLNFPSED